MVTKTHSDGKRSSPPFSSTQRQFDELIPMAARDEADRVVRAMVADVRLLREAKANIATPILLFAFVDAMAWAGLGEGDVRGS